jgi:hypothetical protein
MGHRSRWLRVDQKKRPAFKTDKQKKIYYFVKLLLLDIALFEEAPHSIVNVNKQLKKGSTRVFFLFRQNNRRSNCAFRSWKPCRMHFFTSSQCFWMVLTLQNLKLGRNLEFSWYNCNILRYCSNRCIVWFSIPAICPA